MDKKHWADIDAIQLKNALLNFTNAARDVGVVLDPNSLLVEMWADHKTIDCAARLLAVLADSNEE